MHRDKKIGFALGILLVGIVTAFFFRNEPDPFAELPPLDDPAGLDAQIAEKPITPYADPQAAASPSARQPSPWELPEAYRTNHDPSSDELGLSALPGAPDPINLSAPVPIEGNNASQSIAVGNPFAELPHAPKPGSNLPLPGNESWTSVPDPAPVETPKSNVANGGSKVLDGPQATPTMYKVQQGDTLSLLAEKHLGSSRRFMEIYEANRDKLKNPDDIKLGMTIRIPPRVKFTDALPGIPSTPVEQKSTTTLPPPTEAQQFTPFSRSPLSPVRE